LKHKMSCQRKHLIGPAWEEKRKALKECRAVHDYKGMMREAIEMGGGADRTP